MPPAVKKAVEDELDGLVDTYMDLYEQYESTMDVLQLAMKEGFLWMSEARKSLGYDRVTPLQYPSKMTASRLVSIADDVVCEQREGTEKSKGGEEAATGERGLRRRRKPGKGGKGGKAGRNAGTVGTGGGDGSSSAQSHKKQGREQGQESEEKPQPPKRKRDPMQWFAGLPPPALRSTQRNFVQGAELVVELATIKTKMDAASARYMQLEKQHMAAKQKDDKGDKKQHMSKESKEP